MVVFQALGHLARAVGKGLDKFGQLFEVKPYVERLIPSTRVLAHTGTTPAIHETAFVAPSASVIGQVNIGKGSSIWYGAVVRGDVNKISVGEHTNIGDRAVIHVRKIMGDAPATIGSRVTIGQHAVVHAATLEDESLVGAGAQILDNVVVQKHAMVAAGAVVTPGKTVPTGQLWSGCPARFERELTAEEIAAIAHNAVDTYELATVHKAETSKDYKQVLIDEEEWQDKQERSPDYWPRLKESKDPAEIMNMGVPGRIFNHPLTVPPPPPAGPSEPEPSEQELYDRTIADGERRAAERAAEKAKQATA